MIWILHQLDWTADSNTGWLWVSPHTAVSSETGLDSFQRLSET